MSCDNGQDQMKAAWNYGAGTPNARIVLLKILMVLQLLGVILIHRMTVIPN